MAHLGWLGGMEIPTNQVILGYPGYPLPGIGLTPQDYQYPSQDLNCQLPFIVTLDFHDLSRLTNDLLLYLPYWSTIPTNFPSDIPKFEGKLGEDPSNHVMTYNILCASNSLNDDSIGLRLFQRNLISSAAKWYV